MASATPYVNIARIVKMKGLEGKVLAELAEDLPFCLYEGLSVHFVPPTLFGPRTAMIDDIQDVQGRRCILHFAGIDTPDDVETLIGHQILVCRHDITEETSMSDEGLLDRMVIDEVHGELGRIVEVLETKANPVWVVEGKYGEVLIPAIAEVIVDLPDDESEPVRTHIMEGLIDDDR